MSIKEKKNAHCIFCCAHGTFLFLFSLYSPLLLSSFFLYSLLLSFSFLSASFFLSSFFPCTRCLSRLHVFFVLAPPLVLVFFLYSLLLTTSFFLYAHRSSCHPCSLWSMLLLHCSYFLVLTVLHLLFPSSHYSFPPPIFLYSIPVSPFSLLNPLTLSLLSLIECLPFFFVRHFSL